MMNLWQETASALTEEEQRVVIEKSVEQLKGLPFETVRDRQALTPKARQAVTSVTTRHSMNASPDLIEAFVQQVVAQVGGLGFLDKLLPPARDDLEEIIMNPDGGVWVFVKGERYFRRLEIHPALNETWRAVEALLAPIGRSVSESMPEAAAKLPRGKGMGGARVHILHPVIAPGSGYPSINIRLFEPKPVPPEQLVEWGVAPMEVFQDLMKAVSRRARVLVIGGTKSGKTTLLSGLCHGIPREARVVKIEDPEEIWLDHPHVVTVEARPEVIGSSVPGFSIQRGVDSAMRMSPEWLIVGEVRTGDAALALFRAQMSDHPGLSTFHAEGPEHAIHRLITIMWSDAGVRKEAAKMNFALSVDIVVQVGWLGDRRAIVGVWEVKKELSGGNVRFQQIYYPGDDQLAGINVLREAHL